MPTYKEALKKLRSKKLKPKKTKPARKTRPKAKPLRRARQHAKLVAGKKIVRKKPIKKKSAKKVVKRRVVKPRPKKGRGSSTTRKKRLSGKRPAKKSKSKKVIKKPVKKRIIKKKPIRKVKTKKIVRKLRRKPKSAVARRKKSVGGKVSRRPKKPIKRKPKRKKIIKPRVYIGKGTLDQLFESQAKVKLLRFFFRNAGSMFQPKEIFKRLRSNTALLRQEMKKMEKIGLLKQKRAWLSFEKKRGGIRKEKRLVYYLNPGFNFFSELRDLILKTAVASKSDLVDKARKTGNIKLLALTGVFTGDDMARADLLIVGDKINHRKLNNFIKDLEAEVGKELNCAVLTTKEFDYRYDMYDRFVRDLLDGESEILIKRINLW